MGRRGAAGGGSSGEPISSGGPSSGSSSTTRVPSCGWRSLQPGGGVRAGNPYALPRAGAGVPVDKHGNGAASSRAGSADVLEALGVRVDLPVERAARVLAEVGVAFFFARSAHPGLRRLAGVRAELHVFEDGLHAFAQMFMLDMASDAVRRMAAFARPLVA